MRKRFFIYRCRNPTFYICENLKFSVCAATDKCLQRRAESSERLVRIMKEIDCRRGERIVKMRKKRGLTQDALADAMSISRPAMSKIENGGDLLLSTFMKLLSVLDISPNTVLYEEAEGKNGVIDDIVSELYTIDETDLKKMLAAIRGAKECL